MQGHQQGNNKPIFIPSQLLQAEFGAIEWKANSTVIDRHHGAVDDIHFLVIAAREEVPQRPSSSYYAIYVAIWPVAFP